MQIHFYQGITNMTILIPGIALLYSEDICRGSDPVVFKNGEVEEPLASSVRELVQTDIEIGLKGMITSYDSNKHPKLEVLIELVKTLPSNEKLSLCPEAKRIVENYWMKVVCRDGPDVRRDPY